MIEKDPWFDCADKIIFPSWESKDKLGKSYFFLKSRVKKGNSPLKSNVIHYAQNDPKRQMRLGA